LQGRQGATKMHQALVFQGIVGQIQGPDPALLVVNHAAGQLLSEVSAADSEVCGEMYGPGTKLCRSFY